MIAVGVGRCWYRTIKKLCWKSKSSSMSQLYRDSRQPCVVRNPQNLNCLNWLQTCYRTNHLKSTSRSPFPVRGTVIFRTMGPPRCQVSKVGCSDFRCMFPTENVDLNSAKATNTNRTAKRENTSPTGKGSTGFQ